MRNLACIVVIGVCLVLLALPRVESKPSPQEMAAMADTLKYLQKLTDFYDKVSRPRERAVGGSPVPVKEMNEALKVLQLQTLDRVYHRHSRPRFGKRVADDVDLWPYAAGGYGGQGR